MNLYMMFPELLFNAIDIKPDKWQVNLLKDKSKRIIVLASRQSGKSTAVGASVYFDCVFKKDFSVIVISPSERQSTNFIQKVKRFHREINMVKADTNNKTSISFANGSVIYALPASADTIRGYTANKLIIDEASLVSDDIFSAVSPMLASTDGQMVLLATPHGRRGFYHNIWDDEMQDQESQYRWNKYKITAYDLKRFSKDFLNEEKMRIGERMFNQEYLCEFLDTVDSVFRMDDILNCLTEPLL